MAEIKRYQLCIDDITQGGAACSNPTVNWQSNSENVIIPCIEGDCKCVDIEVYDDGTDFDKCVTLVIDCDDCEQCPPQVITKCLCDNENDCGACQDCIGGFCVDKCTDKLCDTANEVCVECLDSNTCINGQECIGGSCQCPVDKPFVNEEGRCISCLDTSNCKACETCVDGACIPKICTTGTCDPVSNECVGCLSAGDCGPNQVCVNNECTCSPGYVYNPLTKGCDPEPECSSDGECGACSMCVNGECTDIICPDGKICVNGQCETKCNCSDPKCNQGGCQPIGPDTCICKECTGNCEDNFDCAQGCACVDGQCGSNPCAGACSSGTDCGDGCGCFEGMCYPCDTLNCEDESCNLTYGCGCINGSCQSDACGNTCIAHNDCAFGCFCEGEDNICHSCSELSCNNNECAAQVGCQCLSGTCVASDEQLYRCEPEVTQTIDGCVEVMLVLDKSGSMRNNVDDVGIESTLFANNVLAQNGSKIGWISYDHAIRTVVPLGAFSGNISITPAVGGTNYTEAYDKAVEFLKGSSTSCKRYIIFMTDGRQNSYANGPFPGTGLPPSNTSGGFSNTLVLENQLIIDMTDYARSIGIETLVIKYGALTSNGIIEAMANDMSNFYLAPAGGAEQAFDDITGDILTTIISEANCIPAELTWTGDTFLKVSDCAASCGIDKYTCTTGGCLKDANGTLTEAECIEQCNPETFCDCAGGECSPIEGATSGQNCNSCSDACACGTFAAEISYNCQDNTIDASIEGGGGNGFSISVTGAGFSGNYTLGQLQMLSLTEGDYTVEIVDIASPECVIVRNITVSCCNGMTVNSFNQTVCSGNFAVLDFTVLGGVAPYTYTVTEGIAGPEVCSGTLEAFPNNTTSINALCNVAPTESAEYYMNVTDVNGCISAGVNTVTVASSFEITADGLDDICDTEPNWDVRFQHTSTAPDFTWVVKRGSVVIYSAQNSDSTFLYTELAPANGISYTVEVTDTGGCTSTETFTMSTITCASCIVTSENYTWCGGSSQDVVGNVVAGQAPYTYDIVIDSDVAHPANTSGTLAVAGQITYVDNVQVDHTVTFNVTDANGISCTTTSNATVTPAGAAFSTECLNCNTTLCIGDDVQLAAIGGFTGGTTNWYINNAGTSTPDATGSFFTTALTSGNMTICAKSVDGSCESPVQCEVITDELCAPCDLTIVQIQESSGSLTAITTGCSSGITYTWVASDGGVINAGAGTATITTNSTGTYALTVECPGGVQQPCQFNSSYNYQITECKLSIGSVSTDVSCQISMIADNTASCSGPLEYLFVNTTTGTDSGWQSANVYNFTDCCSTAGSPACGGTPCIWSVSVRCVNNTFCIDRTFVTHENCVN